ncbi:MAG: TIGR02452 family protein [Selenomonadaceae bacterium]|nr:TIGR02452 family protein [Selenomonadaceae bacterium]
MAYVTREEMIEVFHDTEAFYKTDENLRQAIKDSIKGTAFYAADDYPPLPQRRFKNTTVSVVRRRTLEAAIAMQRKHLELKIAVHNFASATNPGGGVRHGSRAQEEALCRCSTLYPVLNTEDNWKKFYTVNRERGNSLHDDACIYSPEIIICKNDADKPTRLPRDNRDLVDVITIAAPNLRNLTIGDEELFNLQESRLRHMFTVVAHHGAEIFVTGAFGCGAFKNNPKVVAEAYKKILPEFDGFFKEIVFAIYCRPQETINFDTFRRILFG